jgi:hypothetical protein
MTRYDWSKLDAGWTVSDDGDRLMYGNCASIRIGPTDSYEDEPTGEFAWIIIGAKAQLAKCRIRDTERAPVDNTPLFEAMDRMAEEVPAEQWATVPSYDDDIVDKMPAWISPQGKVVATLSNKPPWRRGPLASWTLVNISCHDGRLTVVMKRGRGELVMETGPDDEVLWERLAQKVESYSTR